MSAGSAARVAALLSAVAACAVTGAAALPAHRPLAVFFDVIAVAVCLAALSGGDARMRGAAIVGLGTASAVALVGVPEERTAAWAAIAGMLIALFAVACRWAGLLAGRIELVGHPLARGLSACIAFALAGAVAGWAVVSGARAVSGLGIGALVLGALGALVLAVLALRVSPASAATAPLAAEPATSAPAMAGARAAPTAPAAPAAPVPAQAASSTVSRERPAPLPRGRLPGRGAKPSRSAPRDRRGTSSG